MKILQYRDRNWTEIEDKFTYPPSDAPVGLDEIFAIHGYCPYGELGDDVGVGLGVKIYAGRGSWACLLLLPNDEIQIVYIDRPQDYVDFMAHIGIALTASLLAPDTIRYLRALAGDRYARQGLYRDEHSGWDPDYDPRKDPEQRAWVQQERARRAARVAEVKAERVKAEQDREGLS